MQNNIIIDLFLILALFIVKGASNHPCISTNSCSCTNIDGDILDLTPLKNQSFEASIIINKVLFNFTYYPCAQSADYDKTVCPAVNNNSVCGTNTSSQEIFVFGKQSGAVFSTPSLQDNTTTLVNYKGEGHRIAAVYLHCAKKDSNMKVTNFQSDASVQLELKLKSVCPTPPATRPPLQPATPAILIDFSQLGDSYFIIGVLSILILITVGVFLYFIISIVIRNKRGRSFGDIRGKNLLCDIPYLIKDGFLTVCSCSVKARRMIGQRKMDYDPIVMDNA